LQISSFDINGVLEMQRDVYAAGDELLKYYDIHNSHPYSELDVSKDPNGNITAATPTLDQNVIAAGGSIGQVFGSAIGRSIAGSNPFAQLAAGTVGGYVGQQLGTILATSLQKDISSFDFASAFNHFGVGLSGAAAGSVASFLTAELGTALGLSGFGAQLFNATVGAYAGSVLNQVVQTSLSQGIDAMNWSSAFSGATSAMSSSIGSLLANQIVHAENIDGAIGGQLGGAVGGVIGAASLIGDVVLDFVLPGIGAFIGTALGTLVGNALGGDKYPQAYNSVSQGTSSYTTSFNSVKDGGDPNVAAAMGNAAIGMANAYLSAVNGVGMTGTASSVIGYVVVSNGTSVLYQASVDGGQSFHNSASADDATRWLATQLLQGTEAIGGNLLMKRAHHDDNTADMLTLAGDLQIAQDYERYLDNTEVINALIAANPNTAFTEGWAATFARVQDLGLSRYGATDFLGGMVTGYLDSVHKAGLSFNLADLSVKHGSDGSVTIAIHVPAGVDIPGALSVFASHTDIVDDATGKTINLVFADGLAAGGLHGPASSVVVNGINQVTAAAGYNIWFGRDDVPNSFTDSQSSSQDVLVGGAQNDIILGAGGADYIDGGAGNDQINGNAGNDILRGGKGADFLNGGTGNDTYVFSRGDGVDTIFDHTVATGSTTGHLDGGVDTLAFATGIKPSDVAFQLSGNDLIIGVKDPANPGLLISQMLGRITVQNWLDPLDRVEKLVFSDGTTLDFSPISGLAAGFATIETSGWTSLMQIGKNYYFYANGIGPEFKYNGAPVVVGQNEWSYIGVEQTATGYEVALRIAGTDQYTVWNTDANGAFVSNGTGGIVSGSSSVLVSFEASFHQDLNGDGVATLEASGATSLVLSGGAYYLRNAAGSGPQLMKSGAAVTAGQFAPFVPIAAEQTSSGYDVAWKMPGLDQYMVWQTDSSGNFLSNLTGTVTGASTAIETLEQTFNQDLNGDGVIGLVTQVLESSGSTSLVISGNTYRLNNSAGTGPQLTKSGAAVTVGQLAPFVLIGAEQTSTGYDIAWKVPDQDQYIVWQTDSSGNFVSNVTDTVSGGSAAIASLETVFQQDLNGDGTIGPRLIESSGSTSLMQVVNNLYFGPVGGAIGPQFKYNGSPVVVGQNEWSYLGAEQTSNGYEVALHIAGTDQYTVWNTDANGAFVSNGTAGVIVSGTSYVLESLEGSFHQDINGDGVIGITGSPGGLIEALGSTSLVQVGSNFYFAPVGGTIGPEFKYNGSPVVVGLSGWTFVGVEQTSTGYEVALHVAGADQYTVWNTDTNGAFVSNGTGGVVVAGTSYALESLEASFHQDINGDGVIGITGSPGGLIEKFGSTSFVQVGSNFYFAPVGGTIGPEFKYNGSPVVVGLGGWSFIGAEQTASGYEVALHVAGADQYTVWNTDTNGAFVSNGTGGVVVSGTSYALESLEASFHQDINGDGVIGITGSPGGLIEKFGSTSLVQVGNNFYFAPVGGTIGPEFKYNGSPVVVGLGGWSFIGVEQTASGYEVALHVAGADQYTVWNTDTNGAFVSNGTGGVVSGTSTVLETLETSFHQDINGDGVIGVPSGHPVVLDLDGNGVGLVQLPSSSAHFDMDGLGVREHTAWASSGDGILAIDLAAGGSTGPDGIIDQTKEIVFTAWAPGSTSDMAALEQVFDTNHNGQLDSGDQRWGEFRIWQDANGDGVSQSGELKTLDAAGISSIGLDPKGAAQTFADGSAISGLANFVWKDGTSGTAADVSFAYQTGQSRGGALHAVGDGVTGDWTHVTHDGWEFAHVADATLPSDAARLLFSAMSHHDWHVG
jgi:20S proteasome alpha/beta subunit